MRLGILLTGGPQSQAARTAVRVAVAARRRGLQVDFFLMGEGVGNVKQGKKAAMAQAFTDVMAQGARVTLCALSAEQRGIAEAEAVEGVVFGSQYELALLTDECDRFLCLG